ncbi:hypothetical protein PASE110613_01795 [Paenibacillus sediminis]|uniref:Uncharacterized protein n=1 Tax=Paenibacillus sediminis TaxID=664909 RepID=A0ABS4GZZ1_9BACL|nr:hypothetical protein [Paenibacillus sediminis]MBP1935682.1 hypothetical protein [Paenibacillus sediminis]
MAKRRVNKKGLKSSAFKKSTPIGPAPKAPKLTPIQISIIAGLLSNFFQVDSVIYNRNNQLKVILTSNSITNLPILGPPDTVAGSGLLYLAEDDV